MFHIAIAAALSDAGQTKVKLFDILVLPEHQGVAVQYDSTVFHDIPVLHDAESHGGILFSQKDSDLLLSVHALDDIEDLVHQHGGQSHRGFVKQHQLGASHQRTTDG